MAKKRPFYKKFRRSLYETVSDSGNSVLRYRGHDDKEYYVASSEDPDIEPGSGGMTEVTWQELKDKRDNGELNPGSLYRITDYNCTTTQENTQSAGHQFDIVLLALSEDKLAEEGWAMEHPTDVYDVTFADGVTKKCYYYRYKSGIDRHDVLVYTDTLLGLDYNSGTDDNLDNFINKTNKTINLSSTPITSELLNVPDLTYNYFQNSNLSAWKVWYCLDNDTDRFAWADDSVDESTLSKIEFLDKGNLSIAQHQASEDIPYGKTAWIIISGRDAGTLRYTDSSTPSINDSVYIQNSGWQSVGTVSSYTPAHEGTGLPNGRGVIYRLIDEWNNDVPYDFKNIQFVRKLTDGHINAQGSDTWCYTFNAYFNGDIYDYSIVSAIWKDDEDDVQPVMNNTIYSVKSDNGGSKKLNDFVFNADGAKPDVYSVGINNNLFLNIRDGGNFEGTSLRHSIFLDINNNIIYNDNANGIIYQKQKVVFENIT